MASSGRIYPPYSKSYLVIAELPFGPWRALGPKIDQMIIAWLSLFTALGPAIQKWGVAGGWGGYPGKYVYLLTAVAGGWWGRVPR